jgi:hypothetical protein
MVAVLKPSTADAIGVTDTEREFNTSLRPPVTE